MHELGIMYHIVEQVLHVVAENGLSQVASIVLQVGEHSSVIPHYLEVCYGPAVDGTMLEHTRLEIELLPSNGLCAACGKVFGLTEHGNVCPQCGGEEHRVLSGREFYIKEIVAC